MAVDLWAAVSDCFDTDDGSLPGVFVSSLQPDEVAAIYAMLRQRSQPAGEPTEFWSEAKQASLPIDSVSNAAALVAAYEAAPFHFCIEGIAAGGVRLPVLGVFVFHESIELDYRMGAEWGPAEVHGFFELLRECCNLARGPTIIMPECEGPPYPDRFLQAWASYMDDNRG